MNRLNRYSFGVNKSNSEQKEEKKRTLCAINFNSFEADAKENEGIAEFVFSSFAELRDSAKTEQEKKYYQSAIDFCSRFQSLKISVSEFDNGTPYNRANATRIDGGVTKCRIYGTDKLAVAESVITGDDLKKVVFGYCTSAGEFVTANGTAPAIYANISALM